MQLAYQWSGEGGSNSLSGDARHGKITVHRLRIFSRLGGNYQKSL